MKTSAPKQTVWWIALVVGVIGIVSHFVHIDYITGWNFWFVAVAFVLLLLATAFKNL